MTVSEAIERLRELPQGAELLAGGFRVLGIVPRNLRGQVYADLRVLDEE